MFITKHREDEILGDFLLTCEGITSDVFKIRRAEEGWIISLAMRDLSEMEAESACLVLNLMLLKVKAIGLPAKP